MITNSRAFKLKINTETLRFENLILEDSDTEELSLLKIVKRLIQTMMLMNQVVEMMEKLQKTLDLKLVHLLIKVAAQGE